MCEYNNFVELHGAQLLKSFVPKHLWYVLFEKLKNEIFDAGEHFLMVESDDDGDFTVIMKRRNGMKHLEHDCIYLIDHAWTFEARHAIPQLRVIPNLLNRVASIIKLNIEVDTVKAVEEVYKSMWKYLRTYSQVISADEPPNTFWYLMDEFGSCIRHSSMPNFRAVPFYYQAQKIAFTLLFPIQDIAENEEVLIDYVEGVGHEDEKSREALLVPWTEKSFIDERDEQIEPDISYFSSGAQIESVPDSFISCLTSPNNNVMKVYSEYERVNETLTDSGFEIVNNEDEADILWLTRHFAEYDNLNERRPNVFINQFPCERVLTTKDLLAIVCRRGGTPPWLPLTYNLVTELPTFVGVFQRRELARLDNHWICKPWNLARALDTTVTDSLDAILRLPFSGPKIAQKYAECPVLFHRDEIGLVKFDVRYVVLLQSTSPLKLYAYKKFFIRFANKAFELNDLWDYEKHFTVMNYREQSSLYGMLCEDFIPAFEKQYPQFKWEEIESQMLTALKEVFEKACGAGAAPPPRGVAHSPQSRALYAADLLLTWNQHDHHVQPILLEVNFGPDCDRACHYYPDFYNNVFNLLFKNIVDSSQFHVL